MKKSMIILHVIVHIQYIKKKFILKKKNEKAHIIQTKYTKKRLFQNE